MWPDSVASHRPLACPTTAPSCHSEPDARRRPSPLHDTLQTASVWPGSVASHRPLARPTTAPSCHSSPTPARPPSPLHDTLQTASVWPCRWPRTDRSRVPQPHRLVTRARRQAAPVAAPRHAPDRGGVARQAWPRTGRWRCPTTAPSCHSTPTPARRPSPLHDTLIDRGGVALQAWPRTGRSRCPTTAPSCHSSPTPAADPSPLHDTLIDRGGVALQRGLAPTAGRVPQPHRLVTRARHQADRHRRSTTRYRPRRCGPTAWPRTGRWPCPTTAPSCHHDARRPRRAAVATPRHAHRPRSVWPCKVASHRPLADVPQPHRIVTRARRQADRRRRSTTRSRPRRCGPAAWPRTGRWRVPQPHRLVTRARRHPAAIAAPRHAPDRVGVARQGGLAPAAGASHNRTVLSLDPDATRPPSPLHDTLKTAAVWPDKVASHRPLAASHTRTVLSLEPDARRPRRRSTTRYRPRRCGPKRGLAPAAGASHTRTVLSLEPDATRRPSGLKATLRTAPYGRARGFRAIRSSDRAWSFGLTVPHGGGRKRPRSRW